MGIDVEHYISRLITPKKEPNLDAIGGLPTTLFNYIKMDLEIFREINVTPIFVLPGLKIWSQFEMEQNPDLSLVESHHRKAWENSNTTTTNKMNFHPFRELGSSVPVRPIFHNLVEFFAENNIEYIVAPYSATLQLHYMHQNKVIDVVYGSTDCLLVDGMGKFIFCMEFQYREFKFLDRDFILSKLNISEKQFKDISFVVGNEFQCETLAIFPQISFQILHDFVVHGGGSVFNALLVEPHLLHLYQRGVAALEFMPVLKLDGSVEPLNKGASIDKGVSTGKGVPNDIHDVISQKMANELYFYLSVGIAPFDLLECLVFNEYVERLPLDARTSPLYLQLVTGKESLELKATTLSILTTFLNRYHQVKKLHLTTYYQGPKTFELSHRIQPAPYYGLTGFVVSSDKPHFSFPSFLDLTGSSITCSDQLISSAFARSMALLGFLNNDKSLTGWGRVLKSVVGSSFAEQLILVLIFFKKFAKSLRVADLLSDIDVQSDAKSKNHIALVSRFLVLLTVDHLKPNNYTTSKVSRSLLHFRSIFNKLNSQVFELLSANLLSILFSNKDVPIKAEWDNDQWKSMAREIPFSGTLPNTLMGIFAQVFFESYHADPSTAGETLDQNFSPVIASASEELFRGIPFFHEVVSMVKTMNDEGLLVNGKEILEEFSGAAEMCRGVVQTGV